MRLMFISNVFPNPMQPTRGPFNLAIVRALSREHDVRVISPVSWTDEWQCRRRGRSLPPGRRLDMDGVEARYPRYYFTPKVLREQYGTFMWRSVRRVVTEEVRSFKPDAVLGYWVHPDGAVAVRAAQLAGVPAAVMVGGSDVLLLTGSPRRRRRIMDVLAAADAVIPVSQDLKDKLIGFGVAPGKVHVVARGVDTDKFCPGDQGAARARLEIDAGEPVLVWVGRMVPVKGLDVLVDACALMLRSGVRFKLYLVGDGALRQSLEAQASGLGMSDSIRFVGSVANADLPDWYRAADVMVLPSRSEGVPNVLRESLACGTPFVASNVGGIPEVAGDPSCRLVAAGDPAALAEALAGALSSRDGRARGRALLQQGDWAESARAIVQVIRPLLPTATRPAQVAAAGASSSSPDGRGECVAAGAGVIRGR